MLLEIGRIGKAHGIKGEATVEAWTDDPENRFAIGTKIKLSNGTDLEVSSIKFHSGTWLIGFVGINDRNEIEKLRNQTIFAEIDITDNAQDEYHLQQLLDCQAKSLNGTFLGKVIGLTKNPGQDLLQVNSGKQTVLVPMVKAIIKEINLSEKTIKLDPPLGLFPDEAENI
ncbi:MAG: ribosome maturation factor RimM [Actinobacteria bacterium]|nr:ribosome maturation factor RimM [Actinomycetota bacterium]